MKHANSFHPSNRVLMGPGPSNVNPRILEAMSRPTIGHLDPQFVGMMDEVKELLHYAFQTNNPLTIPVSAPGSAGMETCFVNLIEPGDTVVDPFFGSGNSLLEAYSLGRDFFGIELEPQWQSKATEAIYRFSEERCGDDLAVLIPSSLAC